MGFDVHAKLFVGVLLEKDEAMDIFGAKYEDDILDKCPKDGWQRGRGGPYCQECGNDLRFKVMEQDGIESLEDLEYPEKIPLLKGTGLEVYVHYDSYYGEEDEEAEVFIGKEIFENCNLVNERKLSYGFDLGENGEVETAKSTVANSLPDIIGKEVKLYFLSETSD